MRYYEICISKWCQRLSPFLEDHVKPWRREGLASCKLVQNRLNLSPKDAQKLNRSVAYFAIFLVSFSPLLQGAEIFFSVQQVRWVWFIRISVSALKEKTDWRLPKPKHPLLESHGALGASGSGLAGGSQDGSGCTQLPTPEAGAWPPLRGWEEVEARWGANVRAQCIPGSWKMHPEHHGR